MHRSYWVPPRSYIHAVTFQDRTGTSLPAYCLFVTGASRQRRIIGKSGPGTPESYPGLQQACRLSGTAMVGPSRLFLMGSK